LSTHNSGFEKLLQDFQTLSGEIQNRNKYSQGLKFKYLDPEVVPSSLSA